MSQPLLVVLHRRILTTLVVLALLSGACRAAQPAPSPAAPSATLIPGTSGESAPAGEPSATPGRTAAPLPRQPSATPARATREPTRTPRFAAVDCASPSPVIAEIIAGATPETWLDWIEKLSGAEPVTIAGEETIIETRFSPAMFAGEPNARAFEYVLETVRGWYPEEQVTVQDFEVRDPEDRRHTWQNLILTLPGAARPDEIVILSAHLDSTSHDDPEERAPGAEDNGSGSAALLEAARLFRDARFERTIQIVWFTGEEQGLLGSRAFVEKLEDPQAVAGAINLDMFGYDSDGDRCFELHVGTLSESQPLGACFIQSIEAYDLDLETYDYKTGEAMDRSDHGSFWNAGIGAIEVFENMFEDDLPGGCPNGDMNPNYHAPEDTVDGLNPQSGIALVRASLATAAALAIPVEATEP